MFCPKCGTETPDDSQFCRKCGKSLGVVSIADGAVVGAAQAPQPKPERRTTLWALVALLSLVAGWAVWQMSQGHGPQVPAVLQQLHTETFNKSITVPALNFFYVPLPLPDGSRNVRLQGHFSATGGIGNDIEVYLLSEDEFANWKNRHLVNAIYSSGRVTQASPDVNVPSAAGTYYLVFNNRYSLLAPKAVEANLTFIYNHY